MDKLLQINNKKCTQYENTFKKQYIKNTKTL